MEKGDALTSFGGKEIRKIWLMTNGIFRLLML